MIFEIGTVQLGIFEPIYYPRRNDSVMHGLVCFGFQVSCKVQVVPNHGAGMAEILNSID